MDGLRRGLVLASIGILPFSAWSQAGCNDDFQGTALAAAWTFMDADGETGGTSVLKDGKLELAGKGSDAFGNVNEFVAVRRTDITGDFDVSVKIESQTNTHEWAQAGIIAANDMADLPKGGYAVVDITPGNGYNAFWDSTGTKGTLDKVVKAGTSGYPVWIRLARTGTKFSAWYRKQAEAAWLPIKQNFEPQGVGPSSHIALFSLSHNDAVAATAVFGDFACAGTTGLGGTGGKAGKLPGAAASASVDALGRLPESRSGAKDPGRTPVSVFPRAARP